MTVRRLQPSWRSSRNELSGKPGAVQHLDEVGDRVIERAESLSGDTQDALSEMSELLTDLGRAQAEMTAAVRKGFRDLENVYRRTTAEEWKLQAAAKVRQALELAQTGRLDRDVIKFCREAAKQDAANLNAYLLLATAYQRVGEAENAKTAAKKAIDLLAAQSYRRPRWAKLVLRILRSSFRDQELLQLYVSTLERIAFRNDFLRAIDWARANVVTELMGARQYEVARRIVRAAIRIAGDESNEKKVFIWAHDFELDARAGEAPGSEELSNVLSRLTLGELESLFEIAERIKRAGIFSAVTKRRVVNTSTTGNRTFVKRSSGTYGRRQNAAPRKRTG